MNKVHLSKQKKAFQHFAQKLGIENTCNDQSRIMLTMNVYCLSYTFLVFRLKTWTKNVLYLLNKVNEKEL